MGAGYRGDGLRGGATHQKECRAPEEPGEVKGFDSFQPPFTGNIELISEVQPSKLELKMLWGNKASRYRNR